MDKSDVFCAVGVVMGYALGWIHAKWGPVSDILARAWLRLRGE